MTSSAGPPGIPGRAMFAAKADGTWQPVTAKEFADRVAAVAAGLIAAGIRPGDRIGLMSATSLDWAVCDFAIWAAGAVTVPVYETSSVEQIRWILSDSGAVAVFAGDARCAEAIRLAQVAKVEALWQLDAGGLDALARIGDGVTAEDRLQPRCGDRGDARDHRVYVGDDGAAERMHDQPWQPD